MFQHRWAFFASAAWPAKTGRRRPQIETVLNFARVYPTKKVGQDLFRDAPTAAVVGVPATVFPLWLPYVSSVFLLWPALTTSRPLRQTAAQRAVGRLQSAARELDFHPSGSPITRTFFRPDASGHQA